MVAKRGSGTHVARTLPKPPVRTSSEGGRSAATRRLKKFPRAWPGTPSEVAAVSPPYSFQLGVPDFKRFPVETWRRVSNQVLRGLRTSQGLDSNAQGRLQFRQAIAQYVSFCRAVACGPDDIVVTAGAQQAFDLLARVLVTPRRTTVALEDPGYPPLRAAFAAAAARIKSVPVDDEGLRVDQLPSQARIICATPSHQFPLGCVMSARRRSALLEFAQARGAVVIEDDYDGEFRFGQRPLDALQTLDRTESVFYVGTFSKSLHPGLRLGYIVTPQWARPALVAAKTIADGQCGWLTQDSVSAFIRDGHLARHVRKMQQLYGQRRRVLLEILGRDFSRWLEPIPSAAGLHVAATLKVPGDDRVVAEQALQSGVRVYALSRFAAAGASHRGLVFGYGGIEETDIVTGLARLRRSWASGWTLVT